MTSLALVLSGGGAKAAAHLGAVKALEEHGLGPARYVGTSMGAVIAACLAAGMSYEEVLTSITRIRRRDVARPSAQVLLGIFARSMFRAGPLRKTIGHMLPTERFDELKTPLTVTAVDIATGDLVLFGDGGRTDVSLLDALCASCALPVLYPPVEIEGRRYVDGGLRQVLPVDAAMQFDQDLVFGSMVGPSFESEAGGSGRVPALVEIALQLLQIGMSVQFDEMKRRWATRSAAERPRLIVIQPVMESRATFAVDKVVEYVEAGYRTAMKALAEREDGEAIFRGSQ